ncbi:hypothetical protein K8T06_09195, partial [bacterium]|nr:hypothetical protein [bacterium]
SAYELSKQVKPPENKVWLLHEIAKQHFNIGNPKQGKIILDEALDLVINSLDKSSHGIMSINLGSLVSCYLENGFYESAMKSARAIPDNSSRRLNLTMIAANYFKSSLLDKAHEIIEEIVLNNSENDFAYLSSLSWYYTHTGQEDKAVEYLCKCKQYICMNYRFGIDANYTVIRFLHWNLIEDAEETIDCINKTNHDLVSSMCALAIHHFDNNNFEKANEILAYASLIGQKVFDTEPIQYDSGDMTFESLVSAHTQLGNFDLAIKYVEQMHREHYRSGALTLIGEKFIGNEQYSGALNCLKTIHRETEVVWLLRKIIIKYNKPEHLDEILEVIEDMSDSLHKTRCLTILAEEYERTGHKSKAEDLISQAIILIPSISCLADKAWALCEISDELKRSGLQLNRKSKILIEQMCMNESASY